MQVMTKPFDMGAPGARLGAHIGAHLTQHLRKRQHYGQRQSGASLFLSVYPGCLHISVINSSRTV